MTESHSSKASTSNSQISIKGNAFGNDGFICFLLFQTVILKSFIYIVSFIA